MSKESIKTINRFLNILETDNQLSPESLQTLPDITNQLNQLQLDQLDEIDAFFKISEIILEWSKNYPDFQEALTQDIKEKTELKNQKNKALSLLRINKNKPKSNSKDLSVENQSETPREVIERINEGIKNSQNKLPKQS